MNGSNTRLLIVIAVIAALLAGVGAGAAIVIGVGGGSSTKKTVKTVAGDAGQSTQHRKHTVRKTIVVRGTAGGGVPQTTIPVTFAPYTPADPGYGYVADLPTGGGWTSPAESHPTGGRLLRTSLRGPDGTFVIIDRTPDEVPQLGGGYDGVKTVSQPYFGKATEYLFSESKSIPECNGAPCVDFLIDDGSGGGWGVLAGGPNLDAAQSIGDQVAQSVSYGE